MSGRNKIAVYQYDRNGKFIEKYDSLAVVRGKYYGNYIGKFPIFGRIKDYHLLPDGTILFKERIYRDNVITIFNRIENPLVENNNIINPIEVLNMNGDIVATFKNENTLSILTGISKKHIWGFLNRNAHKNIPRNKLKISLRYAE